MLALVVVFSLLWFRLGYLPLIAPDEGRNAEVGREMQKSGAWLVPTYNGVDYLDKPASYFKLVAFSLSVFGDTETAARIPSATFGVALLALVFLFCRKAYGGRCGTLAVIIVATMPLFFTNARTVIFDMALAFFTAGAVFAGFLAEQAEGSGRRGWYLVGAASAGCATLIKGPVGLLIPALVLLAFNRIEGRPGVWKRILHPLNLAVFFAVTLPWFIGLCIAHRDFLHYGLVEETFNRFTTARKFHRAEPVYFYVLIVAAMFFPWSLLLPEAILAAWKERWAKRPADRLCLVWSLVVILFFSISQSKLPGYILSVTVACGILLARLFDAALRDSQGRAARLVQRAAAGFAVACLIAALAAGFGVFRWAKMVRFLRIPDTDAEQLAHAVLPLVLVLLSFAALGLVAQLRRSVLLSFLCLALFPPICVNTNARGVRIVFEAKSGRRLAGQLAALPPQTEVACLECFPNAVPFYLRRTVTLISRDGSELTSNYVLATLGKESSWPEQIVRVSDFHTWLASRRAPVYLIARCRARGFLESLAASRNTSVQLLSPEFCGTELPPPTTR